MTTSRPPDTLLHESVAVRSGRNFFLMAAAAAVASTAILALAPAHPSFPPRLWLIGANGVFALACVLAARISARPRFPMHTALFGVAATAMVLAGFHGLAAGEGLRSPALNFCSLLVCVVGTITSARCALGLGLFAGFELALLAWLEANGALPGITSTTPLGTALLYAWLAVLFGAIAGSLVSGALNRALHAAAERERRFRGLLRIAADWYWEQDREFRFTRLSPADASASAAHARRDPIDPPPWDPTHMGLSADELDAHHADLEAHRAFSGLLARRRDSSGDWRTISVSGAPKFDAGGAFSGYWGVARDVTDEVLAQRAVAASETRYRELFTRSPSALLLHRNGTVFDANEAAARLFGFANAAATHGLNIASLFPAGAPRDRLRERIARLETMALGDGLPVADFQLRAIDGRPLSVQATAVRVDTVGGAANLSIFFDITARKAAEGALRHSEAMLSHLFATSPDCITLTETATGRYAMVNAAFGRLIGYSSDEALGRTATELGVWNDPGDRARLLGLIERDATVIELPVVFVAKSGALVLTLVTAGRFVMDQRDYLVINARDVTESARTRLQHSAILERASIGIAFTRDRHFVLANPCFERMFGWEAGALAGQAGSVVWASEADHREIGELAGPLLAAAQPFEAERQVRRRDGSRFWCRFLAQVVDRNEPARGGTIWIAEDVTERRRLDAALAAARDAAEAASRAKSAFLANTSHEIRTPLNGLLGLARLALQPDLPEARRQQYLAQILDSAQALAGIMSDILDVSKIEAGQFALDDTPFDLREVLQAVHHAYDALAEAKGLRLRLAIDERLPVTVRGDPVRVRQILSNFITNALKFTERGQVRIDATRSATGALRLAVSDTGPGLTPQMQERLFTPFSQGDASTTRRFGGTGLGLSICRELAQLMGGTVGVDSTPGSGSTFWAELPLPSSAPAPRAASTEASDLAHLHGMRVLMAEDNPVNMLIAVAMLEHWGVRVEQAVDGRAAVDAVHAAARDGRPFDLVLMDVQMPVMGGHEAARELRRDYAPDALSIVALTAAALVSERDAALSAGMDDFLTKPIDATQLRQTLARHVSAAPRKPA